MKNCNTTELNGKPFKEDLERRLGVPGADRQRRQLLRPGGNPSGGGAPAPSRMPRWCSASSWAPGWAQASSSTARSSTAITASPGSGATTCSLPTAPSATAGKRGCVETFISGPALEAWYEAKAKRHLSLAQMRGGQRPRPRRQTHHGPAAPAVWPGAGQRGQHPGSGRHRHRRRGGQRAEPLQRRDGDHAAPPLQSPLRHPHYSAGPGGQCRGVGGCAAGPRCLPGGPAVVSRHPLVPLSQVRTQSFHDRRLPSTGTARSAATCCGPSTRAAVTNTPKDSGHQRAGRPRGHGAPDPLRHQSRSLPPSGAAGGQQHAGGGGSHLPVRRADRRGCPGGRWGWMWCWTAPGCSAPGPMPNCIWGRSGQGARLPSGGCGRGCHHRLRGEPSGADGAERIVSNASCTTNCVVPVIETLHREFEINCGTITTIHSAMHDQQVIDAYHSDLR